MARHPTHQRMNFGQSSTDLKREARWRNLLHRDVTQLTCYSIKTCNGHLWTASSINRPHFYGSLENRSATAFLGQLKSRILLSKSDRITSLKTKPGDENRNSHCLPQPKSRTNQHVNAVHPISGLTPKITALRKHWSFFCTIKMGHVDSNRGHHLGLGRSREDAAPLPIRSARRSAKRGETSTTRSNQEDTATTTTLVNILPLQTRLPHVIGDGLWEHRSTRTRASRAHYSGFISISMCTNVRATKHHLARHQTYQTLRKCRNSSSMAKGWWPPSSLVRLTCCLFSDQVKSSSSCNHRLWRDIMGIMGSSQLQSKQSPLRSTC